MNSRDFCAGTAIAVTDFVEAHHIAHEPNTNDRYAMHPFNPLDAATFLGLAMLAWAVFVSCALLSPPVQEKRQPALQNSKPVRRVRRLTARN